MPHDEFPRGKHPVRSMSFLGVEACRLVQVDSRAERDAIVINLDNQAGRPDDMVSIGLTPGAAAELRDQIAKALDELGAS